MERELRGTSDRLIATLEELQALEDEKRALRPGSARFVELASRIERLARTVLDASRAEEGLAERSHILARTGRGPDTAIDEVRPRAVHVILAEWRDAERRLQGIPKGSPDHDQAAADVRRLREEYRSAVEYVRAD